MNIAAFALLVLIHFLRPDILSSGWAAVIFLFWLILRYAHQLDTRRKGKPATSGDSNDSSDNVIVVFEKLHIEYVDSQGEITSREIHTRSYDPDRGHITARCMIRKSERTFRIDRIKKAVVVETGEVITSKLRSYLRKMRHR